MEKEERNGNKEWHNKQMVLQHLGLAGALLPAARSSVGGFCQAPPPANRKKKPPTIILFSYIQQSQQRLMMTGVVVGGGEGGGWIGATVTASEELWREIDCVLWEMF